jgi:hypothetical protein
MHRVILAVACIAGAAGSGACDECGWARAWGDVLEAALGALLLVVAYLYAKGIAALWRSAGVDGACGGRGRVLCVRMGMLAIALLPPLDTLTHRSLPCT